MPNPESLGGRLFEARLQLAARRRENVSQPVLARLVSVKPATISRYEAGKAEPDLGMIVRLAAALGVTPGWLAFGEAAGIVPINGGEVRGDDAPVPQPLPPATLVPRPVPRPALQAPHRPRKRGQG